MVKKQQQQCLNFKSKKPHLNRGYFSPQREHILSFKSSPYEKRILDKFRGSGVPTKKPDVAKKAQLQRKLDNKLGEMSAERKINQKK